MKTIATPDNLVHKYIHDDGSETSIKSVASCNNTINSKLNTIEVGTIDRNKYSIFISSSVGCYLACNFCHLTIKDGKYKKLDNDAIIANIKEAVIGSIEQDPSLKERYVKICWMGMGDALNAPMTVHHVTHTIMEWIMSNGYAIGLDGVDLSTVMPNVSIEWVNALQHLNDSLCIYSVNPNNDIVVHDSEHTNRERYINRSIFRLFYSLHSVEQDVRSNIIPNTTPLDSVPTMLNTYSRNNTYNVILHYMFMDGINDSPEQIEKLLTYIHDNNMEQYEFRVLRYNPAPGSDIVESPRVMEIVSHISDVLPFVKIQISKGEKINAACGQFFTNYKKQ